MQESRAPDDAPVRQEVMHYDYLAVTRGPLVYATGLIDGYKIEETLRVPCADRRDVARNRAGSRRRAEGPDCASRRSAVRRSCSLPTIARVDVATAPGG